MKNFKKFLALVLALSMAFSFAISSSAMDEFPNMEILGLDSFFFVSEGEDSWQTNAYGRVIEDGKSFSDIGVNIVSGPTYWHPEREFAGWEALYEVSGVDEDGWEYTDWVTIPGTTILSTEEMLNFAKPAEYDYVIFRAKWAGNDEDYYSYVNLMGGFMREINVIEGEYNYVTEGFGERVREGYSINDLVYVSFDVEKAETEPHEIEGWILMSEDFEFDKDENGNVILYTVEQIANYVVGKDDVTFVAKWDDKTFEDYEEEFRGDDGSSEDEYIVIESEEIVVPEDLPEELKEKFDTPDKIKNEFANEFEENGFLEAESKVVFMEISLITRNDAGEFVPVDKENFPEEGLEITISYPEGTYAEGFDFVVAHLKNDGKIEILIPEKTEYGLVVKVESLSPFAVLYNETEEEKEDDDDGKPNPGVTDIIGRNEQTENNPNTGAPANGISVFGAVAVLAAVSFLCRKK